MIIFVDEGDQNYVRVGDLAYFLAQYPSNPIVETAIRETRISSPVNASPIGIRMTTAIANANRTGRSVRFGHIVRSKGLGIGRNRDG